tara:strand:+ start:10404 stop:10730 length:327 start_codon:yes stop_codon:yes gene_type:complete
MTFYLGRELKEECAEAYLNMINNDIYEESDKPINYKMMSYWKYDIAIRMSKDSSMAKYDWRDENLCRSIFDICFKDWNCFKKFKDENAKSFMYYPNFTEIANTLEVND